MLKTLGKAVSIKPLPVETKMSLGLMVEENAAKTPHAPMVTFEGRDVTWGEFNALANRLAHYLEAQGIGRGDTVALLMDNRVEHLAGVTAICKLGAVASMINTNLTGQPLLHCIQAVRSKGIVFGTELTSALEPVKDELREGGCERFIAVADAGEGASTSEVPPWASRFDPADESLSTADPPVTREIQLKELAYYIFTSGTTGLPKASKISHDRHHRMARAFSEIAWEMQPSDRIYVCLPLYHSSAMYIGFGAVTHAGASMFLRRKFSASSFLEEAREHRTNGFIYIGELCRYLLHQPARPDDGQNPIVKAVGNGLRPDIWMEFKNRYQIAKICEFYGASEGNAGCVNAFNKDLTVGFCATKHAVVQYDVHDDEIVRDARGLCKKVKKGEPGLFVIEINEKAVFDGYADGGATEKKILRDVLKKGDRYFNTGDLLRQVDVGFALGLPHYQFVDRVGDTYRWKGENVSTNEIGEILNACDAVQYCNVYGVQLPGTDGRAGMVAVMPKTAARTEVNGHALDLAAFSRHVMKYVPAYARPIFVRQIEEMDTTGTFKMKKGELRDEAFHPDKCPDPVYVLKPGASEYVPLDAEFYAQIMSGSAGY
jgi:citronellyl-CoA synthetase